MVPSFTSRSLLPLLAALTLSCSHHQNRPELAEDQTPKTILKPITAEALLLDIKNREGSLVLVNVWSTWCEPCKKEFPYLLDLHRKYEKKGFHLILVSADFPEQVPDVYAFLRHHQITFPTFIKEGKDTVFIETLHPQWTGTIPATFIYDSTGSLRDFWEGEATYEIFEKRLLAVMKPGKMRTKSKEIEP